MKTALWLFVVQGALGAFDTLYYHEWRARLPGGVPGTRPELRLHAYRDFIYAWLFGTLPFFRYEGAGAWLLLALLATEIVITLRDFVVEQTVRKPLGGVDSGERVTHAVMGILFGAVLAYLVPELLRASTLPTAISRYPKSDATSVQAWVLAAMAVGVLVSGVRDLGASFGIKWMQYPWRNWYNGPTS